jgi:multiple sugar transport system substrate-binding protein
VDGGEVWGIPWYVDTRVLFYRSDLLREAGFGHAPRTWDEWLRAARAVKAKGHAYAQLFPTDEWAQPVILGMQLGSPLLVDGGRRGAFSGPQFTRGFEFYVTFFREGLAPEAINAQLGNIYQQFAEGWYAMYLTGPWNLGEFRRRLPQLAGRWDAAPLPHPSDPTIPGVSLAGGSSLVVFAGSPHQEAAWKFIEYLSRPEVQVAFYGLTGDLPAHRLAWLDPVLRDDRQAQAFHRQLGFVQPYPKVAEWEQIAQQVAETGEYAVRGRLPVAEALRRVDGEVAKILEKRRWMLARARGGR